VTGDDRELPPYFSTSVLGNAAWRILAGHTSHQWDRRRLIVDAESLRHEIEKASEDCARCDRHRRYGPTIYGCWHEAALLLLDQGLRPWTKDDS
jgi:hypothetical protein